MIRKLSSLLDEDLPDDSSKPSRTRPRLEFDIQLATSPPPSPSSSPPPSPSSSPPPPPSLTENQDLNIHTDLRMCFYFQQTTPALEQPQPQPPPPQPPLNDLRMCILFPEQPQPQPLPPPPQIPDHNRNQLPPIPIPHVPHVGPPRATRRQRRNPTHAPRQGKPAIIEPPFPWATNRRSQVYTLQTLTEMGITTISGDVQCKRCDEKYQIEFDLEEKFAEVAHYVAKNKDNFRERAPATWMNPTLPTCTLCHQENSLKPKPAEKKRSVNWLFLLLGQMLGCCTLDQLKYFCKHTGHHRTGAKDRVLFLTYLGLCKQVDPEGPFDRCSQVNGYYN